MSDEKALLAAIWAHPQEDTPRLAYADWLQETGVAANVARAEFIRHQIELSVLPEDDKRYRTAHAAANKLLCAWGKVWKAHLPRAIRNNPWHRGFLQPDDRGINAADLFKMSAADLTVAPCRGFCVMDSYKQLDKLLAWSMLDRLDTFYMRDHAPSGKWLPRVLACPGFRNVSRICFIDCPIQVQQLEALLTAWQDRRIVAVHLGGTKIGDDGLLMLLSHPALATLRELGTSGIGLTAAGVKILAQSQYHPPEQDLVLSGNAIGAEGVAELVRWPGLSRIKALAMNDTEVGDEGVAILANCKAVRSVRKLWLAGNHIAAAGATALVNSPHLRGVTHLYLHRNHLSHDSLMLLQARFGKHLKGPRV
jgi:uncharacterized protein (TIGR02996 family)